MSKYFKTLPSLSFDFMRTDIGGAIPLLDNVIRHRGTPMYLSSAIVCPCIIPPRDGGTGQAIPDCPSCSGTGIYYHGKDEIIGVVQGVNANSTTRAQGLSSEGNITVVLPSETMVSEGDRLHLFQNFVTIRHIKKYKARLKGLKLPFNVEKVKLLGTTEPHKLEFIELKAGTDYSLDTKNNSLHFVENRYVYDGSVITGVFIVTPYYLINGLPSAFRGQMTRENSSDGSYNWVKMQQTVTAIRADLLMGRMQKPEPELGPSEVKDET